ncbi:MAG: metallophosphoesterase [Lentimicrobiaceae bacterium]|nr:metallophosphoesterase [Lentimicrobiaceae bacterium]
MIIQYASDLHLEFSENKDFLSRNPIKPLGDVLILAGDIVPFAIMDKHSDFFKYVSDNFEKTYWIPGNHEYYYAELSERCGTFKEKIKDNVHLVNNTVIENDNVNLVFSTLWSEISIANRWHIERNISDFQVIKYKGSRFNAEQFNQLHAESFTFLNQALHHNYTTKTIVVTHHAPTFLNYPEKYKGDVLNEAFAVELYDLIEDSVADYWIYGHTHFNSSDFKIDRTQLLTNQLGYVKYGEQKLFDTKKFINL